LAPPCLALRVRADFLSDGSATTHRGGDAGGIFVPLRVLAALAPSRFVARCVQRVGRGSLAVSPRTGSQERNSMRRLFIPLVTLALLLLAVAPIAAAPPTPDNPAGHGKALGVVPARNQAGRPPGSANNLSYHGGPVMHTNTVYAIYWAPGGSFAGSATY